MQNEPDREEVVGNAEKAAQLMRSLLQTHQISYISGILACKALASALEKECGIVLERIDMPMMRSETIN